MCRRICCHTRGVRWQLVWVDVFDEPPADVTSREVSVQEVLAGLITQRRCAWFESYEPTDSSASCTYLEPHRLGAAALRDPRQRCGELTWADLTSRLADVFGVDSTARRLSTFLEALTAVGYADTVTVQELQVVREDGA